MSGAAPRDCVALLREHETYTPWGPCPPKPKAEQPSFKLAFDPRCSRLQPAARACAEPVPAGYIEPVDAQDRRTAVGATRVGALSTDARVVMPAFRSINWAEYPRFAAPHGSASSPSEPLSRSPITSSHTSHIMCGWRLESPGTSTLPSRANRKSSDRSSIALSPAQITTIGFAIANQTPIARGRGRREKNLWLSGVRRVRARPGAREDARPRAERKTFG